MSIEEVVSEFVAALEDLGFGEDGPVSGADTVDVVCRYFDALKATVSQPTEGAHHGQTQ